MKKSYLSILLTLSVLFLQAQDYKTYTKKDKLVPQDNTSCVQDSAGNIYFGVSEGVNIWNGKEWNFIRQKAKGTYEFENLKLVLDTLDNLYALDVGRSLLFQLQKGRWVKYLPLRGMLDYTFDKQGKLWCSLRSGVYSYQNGNLVKETDAKNYLRSSLFSDSKGKLWMTTFHDGVYVYDQKEWKQYTDETGLYNNHCCNVAEDKNGNILLSHYTGGFSFFDQKKWVCNYAKDNEVLSGVRKLFSTNKGMIEDGFSKVYVDRDGHYWFCAQNEGLFYFDGKSWSKSDYFDGKSLPFVYLDSKGRVWAGSEREGLYQRKKDGVWLKLTDESVNFVFEARDKSIWVGGFEGYLHFK